MAATVDIPMQPSNPNRILATDLQAHREKMLKRAADREERLPELIEYLDADAAATKENEKPKFRYRVTCTVQEHDPKLRRMVAIVKSGEVDAQNENDAWAMFCDKWKVRVGPRHCKRTIEKLKKRPSAQDN